MTRHYVTVVEKQISHVVCLKLVNSLLLALGAWFLTTLYTFIKIQAERVVLGPRSKRGMNARIVFRISACPGTASFRRILSSSPSSLAPPPLFLALRKETTYGAAKKSEGARGRAGVVVVDAERERESEWG